MPQDETQGSPALAQLVRQDTTAAPIAIGRMALLAVGGHLETLSNAVRGNGGRPMRIEARTGNAEADRLLKVVSDGLDDGTITLQDIEWAQGIDALAVEAEGQAAGQDMIGAIDTYRKALAAAPGCDVYLMSIAVCYANLGFTREAVAYLRRANQINPASERIKRHLDTLQGFVDRQEAQ